MRGSHQHVAFVDLTTESVRTLDIPHSLRQRVLGGRGLGVALLAHARPVARAPRGRCPALPDGGPAHGIRLPARESPGARVPLTAHADRGVGHDGRIHRDRDEQGRPRRHRRERPREAALLSADPGLTDHRSACVGSVGTRSGRDRDHGCRLRTRTRTCWRSARRASAFPRSRPSSTTRAGQAVCGMGLAVCLAASV